MNDKVFVDSKGILNWIPETPYGQTEGTKGAIDMIKQLLDEHGPMRILIDLSKSERPDKHQRQIIINALRNNFHNVSKIALFGVAPVMKAVAFFIINSAGYSNLKFFSSRSQAESWLMDSHP